MYAQHLFIGPSSWCPLCITWKRVWICSFSFFVHTISRSCVFWLRTKTMSPWWQQHPWNNQGDKQTDTKWMTKTTNPSSTNKNRTSWQLYMASLKNTPYKGTDRETERQIEEKNKKKKKKENKKKKKKRKKKKKKKKRWTIKSKKKKKKKRRSRRRTRQTDKQV